MSESGAVAHHPVGRVLIIVVARIGDTLLATPTIEAIRRAHPKAQITVLAHPKRMELLRFLGCVDRLECITKHRARWRGWLPGKRYDLALVYGGDRELVRYALRVSRRVAAFDQKELPGATHLIRVPRPAAGASLHAVHERLLLAEATGASRAGERLHYVVAPQERSAAEAWIAARAGKDAWPRVALQIASFPTKAHRDWPIASFAELIRRLTAVYPQGHFLLVGDAIAREKAKTLVERFGPRVTVAAGSFKLRESAALIACADLYVGVDTGPTHVAGAIGVPMVGLYHNAYPGRYLAPLGHPACVVIEHPATGRSSAIEESMADIGVDQVFEAARQLLDTQRKAPA